MTPRALRALGVADVASGALALVAASWLAGELDVGTAAIRIAGALLVVLGVETYLLAARPLMAKVTIAVEALSALLAVDVLVLADPTGMGQAILVATALWCAAAAVEVGLLQRARTLTPA
jgi:hypothetical protein